MTNVMAPSSEARTTYKSYYATGILDSKFVFYIPVYNNMPSSTSLPSKGNPNNYLSNLVINNTKVAGFDGADVPQAAIFVKKDSIEKTELFLKLVVSNVKDVESNKEEVVSSAKQVDKLLTTDSSILLASITRCNFKIVENEKESIDAYFKKVIELGQGASVGGKLPDEDFYYQK